MIKINDRVETIFGDGTVVVVEEHYRKIYPFVKLDDIKKHNIPNPALLYPGEWSRIKTNGES